MKISTLIQALDTIGRIYRSEDGSRPAEAVREVIGQLQGAEEMTLVAWVAMRAAQAERDTAGLAADPAVAQHKLDEAIAALEQARTQAALRARAAGLPLRAAEWQALAEQLTGWPATSEDEAREMIETHFSDRLLLEERIAGVKRDFG